MAACAVRVVKKRGGVYCRTLSASSAASNKHYAMGLHQLSRSRLSSSHTRPSEFRRLKTDPG